MKLKHILSIAAKEFAFALLLVAGILNPEALTPNRQEKV